MLFTALTPGFFEKDPKRCFESSDNTSNKLHWAAECGEDLEKEDIEREQGPELQAGLEWAPGFAHIWQLVQSEVSFQLERKASHFSTFSLHIWMISSCTYVCKHIKFEMCMKWYMLIHENEHIVLFMHKYIFIFLYILYICLFTYKQRVFYLPLSFQ